MSKKKIIIWIIIIFLFGVGVVYFVKIKNTKNKLPDITTEEDYLGINCGIFGFSDIERRGDVLWDKKDLCLIAQAKNELNVKKCPKYKYNYSCIEFIAAEKKDYSICDIIEGYKGDCIIGVAKEKLDTSKCLDYFKTDEYNQYDCLDIVNGEKLKIEAENWSTYNNKKYFIKYPNTAEVFVPGIISKPPDVNSSDVVISTENMAVEIINLNLNNKEKGMNFEEFTKYAIDGYFNQDYNRRIDGELVYEYNEAGIKLSSIQIEAEADYKMILFEHKKDRYLVFVRFSKELNKWNQKVVEYFGKADILKRENLIILNQILNTFKFVE